jgi:hypothetical protein
LLPKHSHLLPRTGNTPIAYRGEAIAAGNDHELVAGRTHKNRGVPLASPSPENESAMRLTMPMISGRARDSRQEPQ